MRAGDRNHQKLRGFTLVEMAIVLVIIGIILAGVMKGRDIVRSSQIKQFSQGFAQKWVTIAQTYYDKTGQMLGDGTINGGVQATSDGRMDSILLGGTGATQQDEILSVLKGVGIDPCSIIKSDKEDLVATGLTLSGGCANDLNVYTRTVEGEFTGKRPVSVGIKAFLLSLNSVASVRNTVYLVDVPLDVAMGLDTVIDGQARGDQGNVVNVAAAASGTQNGVAGAWSNGASPANPTAATTYAWPAYSNTAAQFVDVVMVLDN